MWRENTFSMRSEQGGEERSELLIDVQQMSKIYNEGRENEVRALDNISLSVQWGEFLCILGQSGSGKSTLMNILGCLDIPTYGTYYLDGQPVSDMKPSVLAGIRNREIGFIFQGFNLIPALTAIENVELPLIYRGIGREERRRLAADALCSWGSKSAWITARVRCPAASSSALLSHAPWRQSRPSSWRTSRPAIWTPPRASTLCAS